MLCHPLLQVRCSGLSLLWFVNKRYITFTKSLIFRSFDHCCKSSTNYSFLCAFKNFLIKSEAWRCGVCAHSCLFAELSLLDHHWRWGHNLYITIHHAVTLHYRIHLVRQIFKRITGIQKLWNPARYTAIRLSFRIDYLRKTNLLLIFEVVGSAKTKNPYFSYSVFVVTRETGWWAERVRKHVLCWGILGRQLHLFPHDRKKNTTRTL